MKNKTTLNETININGSKIFVENGKVKTVLNENINNGEYMSIEEARQLTLEKIKKIYQLNNAL